MNDITLKEFQQKILRIEGTCTGNVERWFFDKSSKQCEMFHYGGCQGNTNNFLTSDDCDSTCVTSGHVSTCDQSVDVGPCQGQFPRWFYDGDTGTCSQFMFGGCGGNRNR